MVDQNKQKNIYDTVDLFFRRVLELKDSEALEKYFRFLQQVPNHAPFNNTLVFIQNPKCSYYATAGDWMTKFNRVVKDGVRPMIILYPFSPVAFVYDYSDTEGDEIAPEDFIYWWRENGGTLDDNIIRHTRENLEALNINFRKLNEKEYFNNHSLTTGGYASRYRESKDLDIVLHPRYNEQDIEAYGVLCHEMAHILLGHLGSIEYRKNSDKPVQIIARAREFLPRPIEEIEAELVAWIVFDALGIQKKSEAYIASWLIQASDLSEVFSMSAVLTAASKIREMGKRRVYSRSRVDKANTQIGLFDHSRHSL